LKTFKGAEIETLLFVAGEEGMELAQLASLTRMEQYEAYEVLRQMQKNYEENPNTTLHILEVGNRFILTTKKEYAYLLKDYAATPQASYLSNAALETLSIIAYKQPIARAQIDEIRGVHSSSVMVQKLISRNLVEEKGRLDTPGRPKTYGTTKYFMDYFGLKDLKELPDINNLEDSFEDKEVDLFYERYEDAPISFDEEEKMELVAAESTATKENKNGETE